MQMKVTASGIFIGIGLILLIGLIPYGVLGLFALFDVANLSLPWTMIGIVVIVFAITIAICKGFGGNDQVLLTTVVVGMSCWPIYGHVNDEFVTSDYLSGDAVPNRWRIGEWLNYTANHPDKASEYILDAKEEHDSSWVRQLFNKPEPQPVVKGGLQ